MPKACCPSCGVPEEISKRWADRMARAHRIELRRDAVNRANELGIVAPGKIAAFVANQTSEDVETIRRYLRVKGHTPQGKPGRPKKSIGK